MTKFSFLFLFLHLAFIPLHAQQKEVKGQNCEEITRKALQELVPIFQKNDFEKQEPILHTIQNACGQNELTERLRILQALIEKKATTTLILNYFKNNYNKTLETRWKHAAQKDYGQIYQKKKEAFDFVPLRHAIDSLSKIKALALLNSPYYDLVESERTIALLFADQVDEVDQADQHEHVQPVERSVVSSRYNKERTGISIYGGAEYPLTDTYPLFKRSPTLGIFFSTKLSNPALVDLGMKVRINSKKDNEIEYMLHDQVEVVKSNVSISLGGTVGYKFFDNDKFIISPKAGLFWEMASTGLSELTNRHHYDEYGSYETQELQYYYVHTMRTTVALAGMRHISGKTYIGLEAAYHYIPYNWDKSLLTTVQTHYGSLQLFFRF